MNKFITIIFVLLNLCFISTLNNAQALTIDVNKLFADQLKPQITIPTHYKQFHVKNTKQAQQALVKIHANNGNGAIIFAEGLYHFNRTIQITVDNVILLSKSTLASNTILQGNGMKHTQGVDNLIRVSGDNFVIDGLTLQQAGNHLIQIAGENGANKPIIRNSILQDGYEQLLKVTYQANTDNFSYQGVIENCLFRYTAGIGPNFYIGGIDAHGIQHWKINHNIFVNIASPSKHIAEHAIHLWRDTINNTISNNIIYHANNGHPFADVGIVLESSPETIVKNNIVYFEHGYTNAIEFRFTATKEVLIINNTVNKAIMRRDNAQAIIIANTIAKDKALQKLLQQLNLKVN